MLFCSGDLRCISDRLLRALSRGGRFLGAEIRATATCRGNSYRYRLSVWIASFILVIFIDIITQVLEAKYGEALKNIAALRGN